MFVHLETPIPSCSVAFSSILGPRHLRSIFSTWHQETGALGFWASGGLRRQLPLVRGPHQLTWRVFSVLLSIMVSAFSVMRPSSTACTLTHLTVHYPVPTSYSILRSKGIVPLPFWSVLSSHALALLSPTLRTCAPSKKSNSRWSYASNPYPFVILPLSLRNEPQEPS